MESDLSRYHGLTDYDWTTYPTGCPLHLHQVAARLEYLPNDAATVIVQNDGKPGWSRVEVLLVSIFHLWSKDKHFLLRELNGANDAGRAERARELMLADRARRLRAGIPVNPFKKKGRG